MSYTVEIRTTYMEGWENPHDLLSLTTFAGGQERGRMVQVTVGRSYACLTLEQLDDLIAVATFARGSSLANHPRADEELEW